MTVHDDPFLDAELDTLRNVPPPSPGLRRSVLAAVAREPRRQSWQATFAALWRELGGTRLAAPAFALALALGLGAGWALEAAEPADSGDDDLIALAQLDDTYSELEP